MKKKYYILESRVHKSKMNLIPNETGSVIGVFSKPCNAINWIKENGATFYDNRSRKNYFWALCTTQMNADNVILYHFYNNDGEVIL